MDSDDSALRWYSVRCVFQMRMGPSWTPRTDGLHEYEERITVWRAASFDGAITKAEADARDYAEDVEVNYLGLAEAYALDENVDVLTAGVEVFSLVRPSELPAAEYLDRYFETPH